MAFGSLDGAMGGTPRPAPKAEVFRPGEREEFFEREGQTGFGITYTEEASSVVVEILAPEGIDNTTYTLPKGQEAEAKRLYARLCEALGKAADQAQAEQRIREIGYSPS